MENLSGLKAILKDIERGGYHIHIPVPLTAVDINARLVNYTAEVRVSQTYVNKEKTDIECVYFFPVEEEAAVVEFLATLDGREIRSKVSEIDYGVKEHCLLFEPEPYTAATCTVIL
jgi:Vault protein inter-alpha-trypsin domain